MIEKSGKYFCMPGDKSLTKANHGQELGGKCFYEHHENPKAVEETMGVADSARCGFNKDSLAYCNVRKGDSIYIKYLSKLKEAYQKDLKCHTFSDEHRQLDIDCKDFIEKMGQSFVTLH
jgi:hypothetical protein